MSTSTAVHKPEQFDNALAMKALLSIAGKRKANKSIPLPDLMLSRKLLNHYLQSPSRLTQPSKDQMHETVTSLLPKGAKPLSKRWNKSQLAVAILHWVDYVIELGEDGDQVKSALEVYTTKDKPKLFDHQISSQGEDGVIESMKLSSPVSVDGRKREHDQSRHIM